jgi:hypothetical protein
MNSLESRFFWKARIHKAQGLSRKCNVGYASSAGVGAIQGTPKIALPSSK